MKNFRLLFSEDIVASKGSVSDLSGAKSLKNCSQKVRQG